MGQPIEERRCHLRVTKDVSPFTEAQIGCDDDTGALVEAAEQMEQQGAPRRTEGEITEFIKDLNCPGFCGDRTTREVRRIHEQQIEAFSA